MNCAQSETFLHDIQGNAIPISSLKGKWIIINYWADWCDSCVEEIPELNQFYQNNQDKNIVILGVNYDHMPITELQAAIHKMNIAYPVILEDPASVWPVSEFDALPATFIIGPNGKIMKKIMGENTEESLLTDLHELQKKMQS